MFSGGLLLGATLLAFTAWLHHYDRVHASDVGDGSEIDTTYYHRRSRHRTRLHILFGAAGVLILIATLFGPGAVWVACWAMVSILLLAVVVMAMLDALRTHRYHIRKLPEIRQRLLDDHTRR